MTHVPDARTQIEDRIIYRFFEHSFTDLTHVCRVESNKNIHTHDQLHMTVKYTPRVLIFMDRFDSHPLGLVRRLRCPTPRAPTTHAIISGLFSALGGRAWGRGLGGGKGDRHEGGNEGEDHLRPHVNQVFPCAE